MAGSAVPSTVRECTSLMRSSVERFQIGHHVRASLRRGEIKRVRRNPASSWAQQGIQAANRVIVKKDRLPREVEQQRHRHAALLTPEMCKKCASVTRTPGSEVTGKSGKVRFSNLTGSKCHIVANQPKHHN